MKQKERPGIMLLLLQTAVGAGKSITTAKTGSTQPS